MTNEEFQVLILAEIKSLRQDMTERFDQVDQRLDSIDNRLSWLEKHEESDIIATLTVINNKVNDLHEMFRSVSEVLGDHELRIRALIRRPV